MNQNITIIPENSDLISNLIRAVHRFYPLGFEFINEQFDGYQELKTIVDRKIKQVIENTIPEELLRLEIELKNLFTGLPLYFDVHRNFPSYSVAIEIGKVEFPEFEKVQRLSLKISLLTNCYTFFLEEIIKHTSVTNSFGHPHFTVVISQNLQTESVRRIKEIVTECFPTYQFVDPKILFSIKTNGVPYGQDHSDPKRDYSLFDFLFDSAPYINSSLSL